jgi:SAM-dependent methyltransferase
MKVTPVRATAAPGTMVQGIPAPVATLPATVAPATAAYDAMAPEFHRHRWLPHGVSEAIREAVLDAIGRPSPRLLDLGAGSGRVGREFVRCGDDYIGLDLSFGMLHAFAASAPAPRLVQADGGSLPFADATFDAVLLVQVLSLASGWRRLLNEAMRVLRPNEAGPAGAVRGGAVPGGVLVAGRVVAPENGVDARMKSRLAAILDAMDIHPYRERFRDDALSFLAHHMPAASTVTAAAWTAERRPDAFLERHARGARLAALAAPVRHEAMRQLAAWAVAEFGGLDTAAPERHYFEIIIHRLQKAAPIHA